MEDYFNPETGELILGDIIVSVEKVIEQAEKYGHSRERSWLSSLPTACFTCVAMITWRTRSER